MPRDTPEQVLQSIVDGINTGNLEALLSLYEPEAAFAAQPGNLAHGLQGVRQSSTTPGAPTDPCRAEGGSLFKCGHGRVYDGASSRTTWFVRRPG
jgi:hypothetical protein